MHSTGVDKPVPRGGGVAGQNQAPLTLTSVFTAERAAALVDVGVALGTIVVVRRPSIGVTVRHFGAILPLLAVPLQAP